MSERKDPGTPTDLNAVALGEFKDALAADTKLLPAWREAALLLVDKGVPRDLEPFKKLIGGGTDA